MSTDDSLVRGLRHQLIDRMRAELLSGRYREGEAIRQNDLVKRYGVSRTPVREALIQLEHEGLITSSPNCGARVAPPPPDHVQDFLVPLRQTVEVYALRLCFAQLDEEDFRRWEQILEQMHTACQQRDYATVAEQDIAFHRLLIERSGQGALLTIWSAIVGQIRDHFYRSHRNYADLVDVYREHAAVLAMLRTGNEEVAVRYFAERIGDPKSNAMFEDLLMLQKGFTPNRPDTS